MKKRIVLCPMVILLILCLSLLTSCDVKKEPKIVPIDYTVVAHEDIPKEFLDEIEKNRETQFDLTYSCEGMTYVAKGYGKQSSGGFSISVQKVELVDENVYFKTLLIGPKKGEAVNKLSTYPFIVIKFPDAGKNVIFE